ncbi:MAG: hypothetical protein HY787_09210 [Deltaproteobacteria bacterium]|nr:hypothetical protein [Deltaproteobacteria bacterium]
MSTPPVSFPEFIRFYVRVARLKPNSLVDRTQNKSDLMDISAEAKKKLVFKQAFNEVLEKIRK